MNEVNVGAGAPGMHRGARGRWAATALALLFSVVLAFVPGCGGGVGTGGTGSFSSGPIAGLGSIVVNGVRFEVGSAQVQDDQGASFTPDLAVGMVVDVNSDAITGTADALRAAASTVRVNRFLRAPVTAVNSSAGTFTALGLVVRTSAATFYGSSLANGVAGLNVGAVAVVYGFFDPANQEVRATRVELGSGVAPWDLRAPVSNLTATSFTVGSQNFSFSAGTLVGVNDGAEVRVSVENPVSAGQPWRVSTARKPQRELPDDDDAKVKGFVSLFGAATANFRRVIVNGVSVDVPLALATGLQAGSRVEIEGRLVAGVLIASSVSIEAASEDNDPFEFHGAVSGLNTSNQTFVIRGETVYYGGASTRFESPLTAATLANGATLEVKGLRSGSLINATRIKLDR